MPELPRCLCPGCRSTLDDASGLGTDNTPQPDDISLCYYCGLILVFTSDMTLRRATTNDLTTLPLHKVALLTHVQAELQARRGQRN